MQSSSWRIFFQEQVKFPKSGIWFQVYNVSNKNTFFGLTRYTMLLYGGYEPHASILCELWLGLWRHFYAFKIVWIRLFHRIDVL